MRKSCAFFAEDGSALFAVLLLTVIISLSLLIVLTGYFGQVRYVTSAQDYLQAKYNAESAIAEWINTAQNEPVSLPQSKDKHLQQIANHDSVSLTLQPWGAYQRLSVEAGIKRESFRMGTTVGFAPGRLYDHAVVLSPQDFALVVTGNTRITGNVLVGRSGVKKEALRGRPYTGSRLVNGNIIKTTIDQRPSVNEPYVDALLINLREKLNGLPTHQFDALLRDSTVVQLPGRGSIISLRQEDLEMGPWHIKGSGILVSNEALHLHSGIKIENEVMVLASQALTLENVAYLSDAVLYSPKGITLAGTTGEDVQLISEGPIEVNGSSDLAGNSLVLSINASDEDAIVIGGQSRISGTLAMLFDHRLAVSQTKINKMFIGSQAVIEGHVYSQGLLELEGTVLGCVMTDKFYFYHSPTHYYNWIRDGIINRTAGQVRLLPLIFDSPKEQLHHGVYIDERR